MADHHPVHLPKSSREATPLSQAIYSQSPAIISLLENYGAFHRITEPARYRVALQAAFDVCDVGMANRLLDLHGPYTATVLGSGLITAIMSNQDELAFKLLEFGADPNTLNSDRDETALSLAMRGKKDRLVRALLDLPETHLTVMGKDERMTEFVEVSILVKAIEVGYPFIQELIVAGASVNVRAKEKTPLIAAVETLDKDLVELLIKFGACVDFSAEDSTSVDTSLLIDDYNFFSWREANPLCVIMTPLIVAVMMEDLDMISFLLAHGADPSDSGAIGVAVYMENAGIVDLLLQKLFERYPLSNADFGFEAMRMAVGCENLDFFKKLLAKGIGLPLINVTNRPKVSYANSNSPLLELIKCDDEVGFIMFVMMLEAMKTRNTLNAIVYQKQVKLGEDHYQVESQTALLLTIERQKFEKVKSLVEYGADINQRTVLGIHKTPLQKAAEVGNYRIAEYLIQNGANVNAPAARNGGATALQYACIYGFAGIVELLLRNGADPDAAPALWEGRTALEGAAENGRFDTVVILLNVGVKIDGEYRSQFERAIKRAREGGHEHVVERLELEDPTLTEMWVNFE